MEIKFRPTWRWLGVYLIVMVIIWLCTLLFPEEIYVANFGALMVVSALYYVLVVALLLILLLVCLCIFRRELTVVAVCVGCSLIAGVPVLLLLNNFINGFQINCSDVAVLISVTSAMFVLGFVFAESRDQPH